MWVKPQLETWELQNVAMDVLGVLIVVSFDKIEILGTYLAC